MIYTYDGWNGVLYFSGEVKDPGRDIPRPMAGGVLVVVAIYLLLLVSARGADLPGWRDSARGGLGGAGSLRAGGDTVVRGVILVSLLSTANAIVLLTSRVPYAMSRDRPALGRLEIGQRRWDAGPHC